MTEVSLDEKRLFFAFDVEAPWPETFPEGRVIQKENRHLTLSFLGTVSFLAVQKILEKIPLPNFLFAEVGVFNRTIFLPKKDPHVVAWHIKWLDDQKRIEKYQKTLADFLIKEGFHFKERESFLSHMTIARSPFPYKLWKESFYPIPLYLRNLHLYESLGHSEYRSLWKKELRAPFYEIEHTADIAFKILGGNLSQILLHAKLALAFHFPVFTSFILQKEEVSSFDDIIISLNDLIRCVDEKIGSPIKAVSFHGKLEKNNEYYFWEMIVDV